MMHSVTCLTVSHESFQIYLFILGCSGHRSWMGGWSIESRGLMGNAIEFVVRSGASVGITAVVHQVS